MAATTPVAITPPQRRVIDLIRRHAPVSRADLSGLADLTPGAISRIVKELLQLGLVTEGARLTGNRGQPALPLTIAPQGGVSVGIAFCYGRLDVTVMDYAGNAQQTQTQPFEGKSQSSLVAALEPLLIEARRFVEEQSARFVGVGLALPGHRPRLGSHEIVLPASLSWMSANALQHQIEARLQASVIVENIANSAAISAMYALERPPSGDLVVLNLGHGVGCGLILRGGVYLGTMGFAGEVGRLFPSTGPRPSAHDLVTTLRAAGRDLPGIDALGNFPAESEPIVDAWIERSAVQLFELIRSIHILIAPSETFIAGMLPEATAEELARRLQRFHIQELAGQRMQEMAIRAIPGGTRATATGAAWLPILAEGVPALASQKYYNK